MQELKKEAEVLKQAQQMKSKKAAKVLLEKDIKFKKVKMEKTITYYRVALSKPVGLLKRSCIQETLNVLKCANGSINTNNNN